MPTEFTFKLTISDDMQKVFFTTKINDPIFDIKAGSDVEVWNANESRQNGSWFDHYLKGEKPAEVYSG